MDEVGIEVPIQGSAQKSEIAEGSPKEAPSSSETEKKPLDALLVFGQGPVVERETRKRASDEGIEPGSEDVNFWSKTLALAAAELYKRGQTQEIIVMGGRTGGEGYQSEAELICKELQLHGVSPSAIKLEQGSTNTLENLANVLNLYLDKERSKYKNIGVLGSNYHLPRIRLLMQLFNIDCKTAFSAEEVLRYVARFDEAGKERETWNSDVLSEVERRLDMNEAGRNPVSEKDAQVPAYYSERLGTEQKKITRRGQEEDVWSKALLEMPEYWFCYLGRLENAARIRQILENQDRLMLKDRFGIDLVLDSNEELRTKLLAIGRKLPDVDDWIVQGWGESTKGKLEEAIKKRGVDF